MESFIGLLGVALMTGLVFARLFQAALDLAEELARDGVLARESAARLKVDWSETSGG